MQQQDLLKTCLQILFFYFSAYLKIKMNDNLLHHKMYFLQIHIA
jgi:hypothetical protein